MSHEGVALRRAVCIRVQQMRGELEVLKLKLRTVHGSRCAATELEPIERLMTRWVQRNMGKRPR